jgi:hypothetical protein
MNAALFEDEVELKPVEFRCSDLGEEVVKQFVE